MRRTPLLLLVVLGVVLTGAACGGRGVGSGSATGYAVTVRVGEYVERLDAARLAALPAVTVATPESDGADTQTGPTLRAVLAAVDVSAFARVKVAGPSESVELTAAQVDDSLLLAATRRGTVKLAGPGLDQSRWVRDVTDVEVTP